MGAELEASALAAAGVHEGPANTHPGQGTANRRFVLGSAFVELFWVTDAGEAQSEATRRTRLWDRWSGRAGTCCPFGLGFRPSALPAEPPFATWAYRPAYLPPELAIEMAVDTPLSEPELFYLAFASRRRLGDDARDVTRVAIGMPVAEPRSAAAHALSARGLVSFHAADRFVMTIGLDGEREGKVIDLRPIVPLVVCR